MLLLLLLLIRCPSTKIATMTMTMLLLLRMIVFSQSSLLRLLCYCLLLCCHDLLFAIATPTIILIKPQKVVSSLLLYVLYGRGDDDNDLEEEGIIRNTSSLFRFHLPSFYYHHRWVVVGRWCVNLFVCCC